MKSGCYHERNRHGSALEDPRSLQLRLLQRLIVIKVSHQVELQPGRQPGEQLPDRLLVAGPRPAALPVLHLLRGPPQAPLLRTPLLRPLLRPDRQPGLRGHRGSVRLPLPHVQVHPAAGRSGSVFFRLHLRALQHPAAATYREGTRQSIGVNLRPLHVEAAESS